MRLNLALILIFISAFAASGAPETITNGPYTVSFDMNTTVNYSIQLEQPIETLTAFVYRLLIKTNNYTLAQLSIIEYKNLSDSTLDTGKIIAQFSLINKGYFKNMSVANMAIDRKKGFIFTGLNSLEMRMFQAYYWLDSEDCECGPVSVGKTEVELLSSYPPNSTINLLRSLHIEKSKQEGKPKTLVFAPPKTI